MDSSFVQCRSWFDHGRLMRYRRRRTEFAQAPICPPPSARLARASWSARGFGPPTSPVVCYVLWPVASLGIGIGAWCDVLQHLAAFWIPFQQPHAASPTSFGRSSRWKAPWARRTRFAFVFWSHIQMEGFAGLVSDAGVRASGVLQVVVSVAQHISLLLVAVLQERANIHMDVLVYRRERKHESAMLM